MFWIAMPCMPFDLLTTVYIISWKLLYLRYAHDHEPCYLAVISKSVSTFPLCAFSLLHFEGMHTLSSTYYYYLHFQSDKPNANKTILRTRTIHT